ncbi:hypothetical protein RRG08_061415 [Elysia crispata]|uniref:Uncharacterized protein n=1 Tax=Elysia crispata TaxID=231223 RepID=A0AAE1CTR5_9GAST|nr:hypothetical protein RRG08_061415 [Elysia crispata]
MCRGKRKCVLPESQFLSQAYKRARCPELVGWTTIETDSLIALPSGLHHSLIALPSGLHHRQSHSSTVRSSSQTVTNLYRQVFTPDSLTALPPGLHHRKSYSSTVFISDSLIALPSGLHLRQSNSSTVRSSSQSNSSTVRSSSQTVL